MHCTHYVLTSENMDNIIKSGKGGGYYGNNKRNNENRYKCEGTITGIDVWPWFGYDNILYYGSKAGDQRIPVDVARDNFNAETLDAFREIEEMKKNPSSVKTYE